MPHPSGEGAVCERCGHARRTRVPVATKLARALRGKPARAVCGEPTPSGWACPCRSRFHAS